MKQLLMYLREKTLQERQQALFLEFHGKGVTRLLIVLSSYMLASAKEKKAADRLDVYALHVIIQMHSHNRY